jgi:hypothetical protein
VVRPLLRNAYSGAYYEIRGLTKVAMCWRFETGTFAQGARLGLEQGREWIIKAFLCSVCDLFLWRKKRKYMALGHIGALQKGSWRRI